MVQFKHIRNRVSPSLSRLLFAAYLFVVPLVVLELGVRLWGYSGHHIYDPIYMPFEGTGDIPYVHKPNLANARGRGYSVINTDSLGLRAKVVGARYGPKKNNEYRIAIVGDSGTFGEGVAGTEDTYPQVLEDTLNRRQSTLEVQVFNYGVSAYSVKEMAATLEHRMLEVEPDLVVMTIIDHDLVLSRTPTVDSSGYLIQEALTKGIFSYPIVRRTLRYFRLSYVIKDLSGLWFRRGNGVLEKLRNGELPESYLYVRRFKEIAEEHDRAYVIVFRPSSRPVFWQPVSEQLHRDRISFVDLSFLRDEFSIEQFRASRFDPHPSAAVHHRIGEALGEYVQKGPMEEREGERNVRSQG